MWKQVACNDFIDHLDSKIQDPVDEKDEEGQSPHFGVLHDSRDCLGEAEAVNAACDELAFKRIASHFNLINIIN